MFTKLKQLSVFWKAAISILVLVLAGGGAIAGYYYFQPKDKAPSDESLEETGDPDPYEGWLIYINYDVGYKLRYPSDWTIEETNGPSEVTEEEVKFITFTTTNKHSLHFGIKEKEEDYNITDRTGIGAGEDELVKDQETAILDITVNPYAHIWKEKTKEYFYKMEDQDIEDADFEFTAWLSTDWEEDYEDIDMSTDEIVDVNKLFESVEWLSENQQSEAEKDFEEAHEVVAKFLDARKTRNLGNAKSYVTESYLDETDQESFAGASSPSFGKYTILSATYLPLADLYKISVKAHWFLQGSESGTSIWDCYLVKKDGKFLVNEVKED